MARMTEAERKERELETRRHHPPFALAERWHVYLGGNFVNVVLPGYEEWVEKHDLGGPLCLLEANLSFGETSSTPGFKTQLARAHVAAAAPEMLALLQRLVDRASSYEVVNIHRDADALLTRLKEEISK